METEENAEKDALVTLNANKDLYVRTSCIINSPLTNWESENAYLKKLCPADRVLKLIEPFKLDNHTAVHIRMEGAKGLDSHTYENAENWSLNGLKSLQYWRDKSHYSNFIKRLDTLFEEDETKKIFIATDQDKTYQIFKDLYGDKITFLKRTVYDRSKEQIIYALADAMLLSQCNNLIGSTWSSFTELAIRMADGFETIEMSGTDF